MCPAPVAGATWVEVHTGLHQTFTDALDRGGHCATGPPVASRTALTGAVLMDAATGWLKPAAWSTKLTRGAWMGRWRR
jgi:hypothetical protein